MRFFIEFPVSLPRGAGFDQVSLHREGRHGSNGWLDSCALGLAVVLVFWRPVLPRRTGQSAGAGNPFQGDAGARFLAERGWTQGRRGSRTGAARAAVRTDAIASKPLLRRRPGRRLARPQWLTPTYGLVTGRVSALALDPSDATGNRLYVGTRGGVWVAQNAGASNTSLIAFTPLTDTVAALSGAEDASISIGALTVQPGGQA